MRKLPPDEARDLRRLSRPDAARLFGIDRETLRRYENGDRQPRADLVERMRQVYKLTDEELRALLAWYFARSRRAA